MGFDFARLPALVRQYGEPGRSAAGHFCNRAARQERSQAHAQTHPRRTKAGRLRKVTPGGGKGAGNCPGDAAALPTNRTVTPPSYASSDAFSY